MKKMKLKSPASHITYGTFLKDVLFSSRAREKGIEKKMLSNSDARVCQVSWVIHNTSLMV